MWTETVVDFVRPSM